MSGGVRKFLVSSAVLAALIAVAGCSHYLFAEREPWRHDAEIACLNSGAVKESPTRVRISSINGPGICGMDYPLRVSALGESTPLGYTDEPMRPPSSVPASAVPQHWPVIESNTLPSPQPGGPQDTLPEYGQPQYPQPKIASPQSEPPYQQPRYGPPPDGPARAGPPISLTPPGIRPPGEYEADAPDGLSHPYDGAPAPLSSEQMAPLNSEPTPTLGPPRVPSTPIGPVEVKPAATLACPIVSALDQWISEAVQPAALRWFAQPVVGIKQISAYSCRGMNGNPNAHISEHAFGNALDIAEFELADGRKVSVQYGWRATPEEQGFLHDVQAAACAQFTTVLAPGANVYHYNHIHVDLMRHASGRHICEPAAMSGEVAASRARARYAAEHGDPGVTGAIKPRLHRPALGYAGEDSDSRPLAVPGDD